MILENRHVFALDALDMCWRRVFKERLVIVCYGEYVVLAIPPALRRPGSA